MKRYCPNCKKEIEGNLKYCSHCGKKLSITDIYPNLVTIIVSASLTIFEIIVCIVNPLIGILLIAVSLLVVVWIFTHLCPKCKAIGSLERISQQETGRKKVTHIEKREIKHYKGLYKSISDQVGTSEYEVEVPYQRIFYHCKYRCKKCGNITEKDEYEDIRI